MVSKCHELDERGLPWLAEVVYPDGEQVRFGTDTRNMVDPVVVRPENLVDEITRRRGW